MSSPTLDPFATGPAATLRSDPPVSWPAIFAGAAVSLAIGFTLTTLAAGFGYQTAFPGLASKGSLSGFTPIVGAGAVAIQVISAGLGGYIAGRMRGIWSSAHTDEAHFRDTAHGLITWSVATVAGVILAALVLAPYADGLAAAAAAAKETLTAAQIERASNITAQSFFFMAVGMLTSAFIACVAARIGGARSEDMHIKTMS